MIIDQFSDSDNLPGIAVYFASCNPERVGEMKHKPGMGRYLGVSHDGGDVFREVAEEVARDRDHDHITVYVWRFNPDQTYEAKAFNVTTFKHYVATEVKLPPTGGHSGTPG